jgi:integrase
VLKYGSHNNNSDLGAMDSVMMDNALDLDPYLLFVNSIRSPLTRKKYFGRLNAFYDFIQIPDGSMEERCRIFIKNCNENPKYPLNCVYRFIIHLKGKMEKNEIEVSTILNYLKPIKLLCGINDIQVKWKKVTIGLPKERKYAEDRAPTIEEIQSLVKYPDRRLKVIVSIMISSGIRLAAWDDLKFKHIQPIERNGQIVAGKIIVYPGSEEQYYSFITQEACNNLNEWKDYRKNNGETITDESWVLRNLWDVTTPSGGPRGLVSIPKKLKHTGVKSLIERALRAQGIRSHLEEGKKRYPFATDHGFRKFFKTRCEMAGMRSINIEILLNHSTGISDSYYRPQETEILEDYLKAAKSLTITKNNTEEIEKEIEVLREKNENSEYLINSKLQERDDAIKTLSDQVMTLMNEIQKQRE